MYSEQKEFRSQNQKRKIELIQIDAYNLLIRYLRGRISEDEMYLAIATLAEIGLLKEEEIINFLKHRVGYEGHQALLGKDKSEGDRIRERVKKFRAVNGQ